MTRRHFRGLDRELGDKRDGVTRAAGRIVAAWPYGVCCAVAAGQPRGTQDLDGTGWRIPDHDADATRMGAFSYFFKASLIFAPAILVSPLTCGGEQDNGHAGELV